MVLVWIIIWQIAWSQLCHIMNGWFCCLCWRPSQCEWTTNSTGNKVANLTIIGKRWRILVSLKFIDESKWKEISCFRFILMRLPQRCLLDNKYYEWSNLNQTTYGWNHKLDRYPWRKLVQNLLLLEQILEPCLPAEFAASINRKGY